jgi:hypothetical protein
MIALMAQHSLNGHQHISIPITTESKGTLSVLSIIAAHVYILFMTNLLQVWPKVMRPPLTALLPNAPHVTTFLHQAVQGLSNKAPRTCPQLC